jgi:hypothetical protein
MALQERTRHRLPPEIFDLPVEKMREGYYADAYFKHARSTLLQDGRHPRVVMQLFQKRDAYLGGMDEAIAILKLCSHDWDELTVHALYDGDRAEPWETVMTIEGDYTLFAHLETAYLGVLARRTLITTNVVRVLEAANGKPIIFMLRSSPSGLRRTSTSRCWWTSRTTPCRPRSTSHACSGQSCGVCASTRRRCWSTVRCGRRWVTSSRPA